jgi:hypothetical protein
MEERNAQYTRICQTIFARQAVSCSCIQMSADVDEPYCKLRVGSNFVEKTDVVIWLGDLNYRVELPRSSVGFLISHNLEKVKLFLSHYDSKRFLFTVTKIYNMHLIGGFQWRMLCSRCCGQRTNFLEQCSVVKSSKAFKKAHSSSHQLISMILVLTTMIPAQR